MNRHDNSDNSGKSHTKMINIDGYLWNSFGSSPDPTIPDPIKLPHLQTIPFPAHHLLSFQFSNNPIES